MKRIIAFILCLVMAFSLCACKGDEPAPSTEPEPGTEPTPAPSPDTEPNPGYDPTPAPDQDNGTGSDLGDAIRDIIDESRKPGNGDLGGAIGGLIGTIIGGGERP